MLEVRNVSKSFPIRDSIFFGQKKYKRALKDVSLKIGEKETVGIVGESGSGKSTLGRIIAMLLNADKGEIYFDNLRLHKLGSRAVDEFRRNIQVIFQDPYQSINPRFTVQEAIREPLDIHNIGDQKSREAKVLELMECVGLKEESLYRYAFEFSGGQCQRITIARALALNPRLIIADEPVSALDVSIRSQILNLLNELQEKFGISYIFISHDLNVVKYISHKIYVMYLGEIVEEGLSQDIYDNASHPYTQALLKAIPSVNTDKTKKGRFTLQTLEGEIPSALYPPTGCCFHTRCPIREGICSEKKPPFINLGNTGHQAACWKIKKSI